MYDSLSNRLSVQVAVASLLPTSLTYFWSKGE
jgi:hypothetical protein